MRRISLGASVCAFFFASVALARDPSGEKALYKLDRSRARTSALVQSGQLTISIGNLAGKAHPATISYEFSVLFGGDYKGMEVRDVSKPYFTPEFMEWLRAKKEIIGDTYKVKYLGQADVRTMKGRDYPRSDKIFIYDLDVEKQDQFGSLLKTFLVPAIKAQYPQVVETDGVKIEDAKLLVHWNAAVPALGLVQIDMEGTIEGFRGKVGFDYE